MDIYYEVIGEGFPIICLHGNGEDHHIFDSLTNLLAQDYQMILIDSRYHGKSISSGELSYQQMSQDVLKIVDELNLKEYDIIGFSDGAIIALLLAMQDSRLKHLVSIGANTKPNMIKPIYRLTFFVQMLCLYPFCIYNVKARKQLKLIKLMFKEPHINYSQLKNIKIPVLILAGEFDMIKETDTKNMAQTLPYSVLKMIKGGNHFLLRDSFQQTSKEIQLFLKACHQEEIL